MTRGLSLVRGYPLGILTLGGLLPILILIFAAWLEPAATPLETSNIHRKTHR